MMSLGVIIYAACVDFLIALANLLGVTYRDTNALFFFVGWPLVTVLLGGWAVVERVRLNRARIARDGRAPP